MVANGRRIARVRVWPAALDRDSGRPGRAAVCGLEWLDVGGYAPDVDDLIADDIIADVMGHQMREAGQATDATTRDLELVGEAQAARLR